MRLNTLTSFCGFVLLIAALYCPLFKVLLISINVFGANKPYGMVLLLVSVVGILGTVFNQSKVTKTAAWLSLGLVILLLLGSFLKIHASFNFIPFRGVKEWAIKLIKFKWGWYLIFAGPILAVAGVLFERKPNFIAPPPQNEQTKV